MIEQLGLIFWYKTCKKVPVVEEVKISTKIMRMILSKTNKSMEISNKTNKNNIKTKISMEDLKKCHFKKE